jgi:hypothetical protein
MKEIHKISGKYIAFRKESNPIRINQFNCEEKAVGLQNLLDYKFLGLQNYVNLYHIDKS